MTIAKLDLICLAIIIIFGIFGYKRGAIGTLVSLVGLVASIAIALMIAPPLSEALINTSLVQNTILNWVGSIDNADALMVTVTEKIIGMGMKVLIFAILMVAFGLISNAVLRVKDIPLVGTFDQFLGMGLGALVGLLIFTVIVGALYYFAKTTDNTTIMNFLSESYVLTFFLQLINLGG